MYAKEMKNTSSHYITNFSLYDTWCNTHPLHSWGTDILFLIFFHVCYTKHTILISLPLWVCSRENVAVSVFLTCPFAFGKGKGKHKGKSKVVPVHALLAYTGSRNIASLIFNLSTTWR
jgi:hypothetical protein